MVDKKKLAGRLVRSMCLVCLLLLCPSCNSDPDGSQSGMPDLPEEGLEETVPDTQGPVISGARNLAASVGEMLSYRTGVTAEDDRDGAVRLLVDSSGVDLNTPGEYRVIYAAEDSSGNRAEVVVAVVITEPEEPEPEEPETATDSAPAAPPLKQNPTLEDVEALADGILARITNDGMSQYEKARAIFNYVHGHIWYVGYSDKSSWIVGAYTGFMTGRGDCFNYFACSKALLTRAGIPNVDVQRVGGATSHYWQLVDVGDGYHHFDAIVHDYAHPIDSFMLTEDEARAYTAWRGNNYYVYDYANCPVPVVGLSEDERNPQGADESEPEGESEDPAETAPEMTLETPAESDAEDMSETQMETTAGTSPAPESAAQPENQEEDQ